MEQKREPTRVFTTDGDHNIKCNIPCGGTKSLTNSDGKKVCEVLTAPAIGSGQVIIRMHPDQMRICTILNPEE